MTLGSFARVGMSLGAPRGRLEIKTITTDRVRVIEQKCPEAGKADALQSNLEKARERVNQLDAAKAELKAKIAEQKTRLQRMKVNNDELKARLARAKGK